MNEECKHEINAMIKMPSLSGQANVDGCPFVWCRKCGSIWLPETRAFTQAFEKHERISAPAPIDGVTVRGYWIRPGLGAIIKLH